MLKVEVSGYNLLDQRCTAGYGGFPASFPHDHARFGGRNLRLGLSSILEQVTGFAMFWFLKKARG